MMRNAVFLDRDGVIIENRDDYIKSWEEVQFVQGALEALRKLSASQFAVVLVTNQSVVGRDIISIEQANTINQRLIDTVEAQGGRIDAVYLCPHHPEDGCNCRKPNPGLLLQAAEDLALELSSSYLVGDAVTDIQAAQAVGVRGILVLTGRGAAQATLANKMNLDNFWKVDNFNSAIKKILDERK